MAYNAKMDDGSLAEVLIKLTEDLTARGLDFALIVGDPESIGPTVKLPIAEVRS